MCHKFMTDPFFGRLIERLWRSVKYEDIYLQDYRDGLEAGRGLCKWFQHYNSQRPHAAVAGPPFIVDY